jgi:hypothetical protein
MTVGDRAWRTVTVGLVVLLPGWVASAQDLINPDRPGIADGSKVVGSGRFQIETGLQDETHGAVHTLFVPTLARAGVGDRFEFRIEGNTVTRESHVTGFAPISLGAKYTMVGSDQGPTIGVIARGFPPSGSSSFKTEHVTADLRLAADIPLGSKASLNPNVGIARYEDDGARTYGAGLFALTLNYQPSERLNPFVDVGAQTSTGEGTAASVTIDAGIAWILGRDVQLDISAGQGVSGDAPRPFIAAGISIRARPRR